jgi:hypothetical protein
MTLTATKEAIGAVTEMLQAKLSTQSSINVTVGRPDIAANGGAEGNKLNIFLYHVEFDGFMKNYPLDQGQPTPLWVVLHYLVTAFDTGRDSDSIAAHRLLGQGLTALQELNYLEPNPASPVDAPLLSNPEPLKITFNSADTELLSKLMQGSDEKYRISAAFQIRPVMLMPDSPPSYSIAVKTIGPPATPGVVVLPSMGPRLEKLTPEKFEVDQLLVLKGQDLSEVTEVNIGNIPHPATIVNGQLNVTVPLATTLSAGNYALTAVRLLPSGRRMSSNAVLGTFLPTLTNATHGGLTPMGTALFGDLTLTGERLGGPDDSIFVAFYKDGECALLVEPAGIAAQNSLTVPVTSDNALEPGPYYIILRVNGAQAINSPLVSWT